MIISRTPYRISFFGGGTDYPAWYDKNKGQVLAASIDKYCYITCRWLPPFHGHKHRLVYSTTEDVMKISEIKHPSARACLRFMRVRDGVEVHHDGDLPARSGIGSSSSFTVGLLNSLHALKGRMVPPSRLAADAIHIEQEVLRENVGAQDQVMAAYGGCNLVSFGERRHLQVRPVTVSSGRLDEFQDRLLLFYTGIPRTASDIAGEQVRQTPARCAELRRMCEMVDRAVEILDSGENISAFGRLLHDNWRIKRSLTDRITTPAIDEIYAAGRAAGALGGKVLGAGGGGFMLFFAAPGKQAGIRRALRKLLHVPFKFEFSGSTIIFCNR